MLVIPWGGQCVAVFVLRAACPFGRQSPQALIFQCAAVSRSLILGFLIHRDHDPVLNTSRAVFIARSVGASQYGSWSHRVVYFLCSVVW